jgi:hypothetical protein
LDHERNGGNAVEIMNGDVVYSGKKNISAFLRELLPPSFKILSPIHPNEGGECPYGNMRTEPS